MERKKHLKSRNHAKRRRFRFNVLCYSWSLLVLLVVASYTLYYHNSVASYDRAIGVQERALEEMEKTRSSLYAQVEDIRTSDEILKTARFQLGMVYPGEDQIEYIEVAPTEEEVARDNVFANPVISVLQFLRP